MPYVDTIRDRDGQEYGLKATIEGVEVTTLPTGSDATGTVEDGTIKLGIPEGPKGDKGDTGKQGEKGEPGEKGDPGYSPTVKVEDTAEGVKVTVTDQSGTTTA